MDTRSIDVAKTASIDMMNLNNKVVKMRPIVKRSKAQIVNRLCRHISALKKKKGTEAQKEKNIRKAERLIEEIESIRRLKEDKVSKYSLANTSTFESISKSTLSANMRALARLADHHLMKEVVDDFRQKHNDWRDLAAFLLVKQTGRKFKTKKQKQKKLAQRVENINASETMTKAYIEERFGKEGLEKAEQRFQKKRKKGKIVKADITETHLPEVEKEEADVASHDRKDTQTADNSTSPDDKIKKTVSESETQNELLTSVKTGGNNNTGEDVKINVLQNRKEKLSSIESENTSKHSSLDNEEIAPELRSKEGRGEKEADSERDDSADEGSESENYDSDDEEDESSKEEDQALEESEGSVDAGASSEQDHSDENEEQDEDSIDNEEGFPQKDISVASTKPKISSNEKSKSDECVVKKLKIGASSDESDDSDDEEDEISAEDSDDMEDETNSSPSKPVSSDQDDDDSNPQQPHKKRKAQKETKSKKNKLVPEFLTQRDHVLKNTPSDPFFVGSDGEEGDDDDGNMARNAEMDFDVDNDDFYDDRRGSWSSKGTTKSMFYEPGEENHSGRRFERKNVSSGFRSRGRGHFEYRGHGRSLEKSRGGFRGRGRGSFHSSSRGSFHPSNRGSYHSSSRGSYHSSSRGRGRENEDHDTKKIFKFGSGISRDEKRGAYTSQGSTHGGKGDPQKSFQKFGASSSKDSGPVSSTAEKLHPSWEASRKRKAESGLKAFEGTKIVFDDD